MKTQAGKTNVKTAVAVCDDDVTREFPVHTEPPRVANSRTESGRSVVPRIVVILMRGTLAASAPECVGHTTFMIGWIHQ